MNKPDDLWDFDTRILPDITSEEILQFQKQLRINMKEAKLSEQDCRMLAPLLVMNNSVTTQLQKQYNYFKLDKSNITAKYVHSLGSEVLSSISTLRDLYKVRMSDSSLRFNNIIGVSNLIIESIDSVLQLNDSSNK